MKHASNMRPYNLYLTTHQVDRVREVTDKYGGTLSEFMRRAIDLLLTQEEEKERKRDVAKD